MRIRIYPYKQGSASARDLARTLDAKVLFTDGRSRFRPRSTDLVVNWGASDMPMSMNGKPVVNCLNEPSVVAKVVNKLTAFRNLPEEIVPAFTEDIEEAKQWYAAGRGVVARTLLSGSGGAGIRLFLPWDGNHSANDIVAAPLFTQYIKKQDEYRIHVMRTPYSFDYDLYDDGPIVFDVQRKAVPTKHISENVMINYQIRNHDNGWVFCRDDVTPPDCVYDVALAAFHVIGLDFGAVDVVYNAHEDRAYVLEINTAPGLEGQTLDSYAGAIRELVNE